MFFTATSPKTNECSLPSDIDPQSLVSVSTAVSSSLPVLPPLSFMALFRLFRLFAGTSHHSDAPLVPSPALTASSPRSPVLTPPSPRSPVLTVPSPCSSVLTPPSPPLTCAHFSFTLFTSRYPWPIEFTHHLTHCTVLTRLDPVSSLSCLTQFNCFTHHPHHFPPDNCCAIFRTYCRDKITAPSHIYEAAAGKLCHHMRVDCRRMDYDTVFILPVLPPLSFMALFRLFRLFAGTSHHSDAPLVPSPALTASSPRSPVLTPLTPLTCAHCSLTLLLCAHSSLAPLTCAHFSFTLFTSRYPWPIEFTHHLTHCTVLTRLDPSPVSPASPNSTVSPITSHHFPQFI
ncbi:hypothetical protein D4764_12G0009980 [Takifugu flavidus]|uniref:Uncharacterized protein n=1 Tax=Takifugu flavidus TaxID=433684 RepID=A0A5C6PFZ1_9TELE|nr:hypothetical protein D4764_12G0009980 [Takifugu flavidus]